MDIGGVYLVNFPYKGGREFYGRHYAVVISKISKDDQTLLVAPITGKKANKRYRLFLYKVTIFLYWTNFIVSFFI